MENVISDIAKRRTCGCVRILQGYSVKVSVEVFIVSNKSSLKIVVVNSLNQRTPKMCNIIGENINNTPPMKNRVEN